MIYLVTHRAGMSCFVYAACARYDFSRRADGHESLVVQGMAPTHLCFRVAGGVPHDDIAQAVGDDRASVRVKGDRGRTEGIEAAYQRSGPGIPKMDRILAALCG